MAISAKEFLKEKEEGHGKDAKLCACGRPLGPRFDGGSRPTIDGQEVCPTCYEEAVPDFPNHGTPGRHGPGVYVHLDDEPDTADDTSR